ncbi:hypothetical protein GCM10010411_50430 [Actinomadura fulvescens]|uniref:Uncharacterized protein n=1 Tax=Actinomadura fulvescens TaxID=46160 RepID=A0ABP6CA36_9ACTN
MPSADLPTGVTMVVIRTSAAWDDEEKRTTGDRASAPLSAATPQRRRAIRPPVGTCSPLRHALVSGGMAPFGTGRSEYCHVSGTVNVKGPAFAQ